MKSSSVHKVTHDVIYSIMAVVIFNIVVQIIVNPCINNVVGGDKFGEIIYFNSIIAIIAPAFGMAVNNTQLLVQRQNNHSLSDVYSSLLTWGVLGVLVTTIWLFATGYTNPLPVLIILLVTMFRCYADVEYRLVADFRGYLRYYLLLSLGYLIGLGVFYFSSHWYHIYFIGEGVVVLASLFKRNKIQFHFSKQCIGFFKQTVALACSYLVYNMVVNMDRILLKRIMGNEAVSQYYTATLIGKTLALIIGPLNGLIISYMTKYDTKVGRKRFSYIVLVDLLVGAIFFVVCSFATVIFMQLFYPEYYPAVKNLIVLINVGQIISFTSSLLLNIILAICNAKYQIIIQGMYAILFVILAIFMSMNWGLWGMAIATIIANIIKMVAIVIIGFAKQK